MYSTQYILVGVEKCFCLSGYWKHGHLPAQSWCTGIDKNTPVCAQMGVCNFSYLWEAVTDTCLSES